MFFIFFLNMVVFGLAVFAMNWNGNMAWLVRLFLFALFVANCLMAAKQLAPGLNWGF
jgi:uncharacterized membrane protein